MQKANIFHGLSGLSIALIGSLALPISGTANAQEEEQAAAPVSSRDVIDIRPNNAKPSIVAMAPVNESNVIFLNPEGQVGVAKFSPGLSLIGWDYYSKIRSDAHPSLVVGKNYSVYTCSASEITQAFSTSGGKLDFFQALIQDWPGKKEGVIVTAGPVADGNGRLLFALSPMKESEDSPAKASVVAWHPSGGKLQTVATSILPVRALAISNDGVLASRLYKPDYQHGYYISLNQLPAFDPTSEGETSGAIPATLPSILIPAELTNGGEPEQLCFFKEEGINKLLVTCPKSNRLIEITPQREGSLWQGAVLVRQKFESPVSAVIDLGKGRLLGGGRDGFRPIEKSGEIFRINSVSLANDGIEVEFTQPIERFSAIRPDVYAVKTIRLQDGTEQPITIPEPLVESNGKAVILRTGKIQPGSILRLKCVGITAEDSGASLQNPTAFFTVHQR